MGSRDSARHHHAPTSAALTTGSADGTHEIQRDEEERGKTFVGFLRGSVCAIALANARRVARFDRFSFLRFNVPIPAETLTGHRSFLERGARGGGQ